VEETMKKHIRDESGVAVVEAAIYLPVVIAIVFFLVYLAFFYMEEFAMFYVVERAASETAREIAYQGYTQLGMNEGDTFEFSWEGSTPSEDDVNNYYKAYYGNANDVNKSSIKSLYREIANIFPTRDYSDLEEKYDKILQKTAMISIGTLTSPEITVKRGIFSSDVTVTVSHEFRTPGIMRYLGVGDEITIKATTKKLAICPANFVRTVDLGTDLVDFLLEKLDKNGTVKNFISKTREYILKIL
jgi:hypothetical protein